MELPVITTRGVIVFPGHATSIDVGRPISLNALDVSANEFSNKLIIVSQKDIAKDSINNADDIFKVGTLVSYRVEKSFDNGAKTVSLLGLDRVKLEQVTWTKNKLILASIKILKSKQANDGKERIFVKEISKVLDKAIGSMMQIPKNILSSLASGISAADLSDVIAHYLPMNFQKKQHILETLDVNERLKTINKYLIEETEINKIESDIDKSVRKTIDGQHKEFLLREKMKAIKQQLGDISSKDSDVDKWKQELASERFPIEIREQILGEIEKYEATPPMAAESNVIKGYLDWIFALPWKTYSKDNQNIEQAKKTLDKYHYGLKKVKERIIEHLAVKMNTKSSTSPIITLVGPPGVGKTSLAQSIAEAVNRKFVKVSLGGVRDESEIRGHRRTYVGAMPGKILQAIKKSKTSNPLILLDEVDKMSSDFRGDPTSAMLEVLDPEQNKHFQDHYLEVEYDLSNVMFLATANYYENIPAPLLDRVELIFLDQYTSEEKLAIAKSYIIPKSLKSHGLTKSLFKISDSTLEYVIDKYTLEAGVRALQRQINKLARKIVLKKLNKEVGKTLTITKDLVRELLGKEKVYKEKLVGKAEVGLVNGMYYSSVGGGILPIEVTTYPAKSGGIRLTGMIKDVMQESLQIAVAYIRTNAKKFGIDFDWEKNIIQVHVPSGATPKDGPSAGIAFTTAVISALTNKPVDKSFSLTGEITLRGKVLPIGGLKEKSLGAVEAGVRTIFIPEINKKDYDDLANKVKEKAKIIPVKDYMEVFREIFTNTTQPHTALSNSSQMQISA